MRRDTSKNRDEGGGGDEPHSSGLHLYTNLYCLLFQASPNIALAGRFVHTKVVPEVKQRRSAWGCHAEVSQFWADPETSDAATCEALRVRAGLDPLASLTLR